MKQLARKETKMDYDDICSICGQPCEDDICWRCQEELDEMAINVHDETEDLVEIFGSVEQ